MLISSMGFSLEEYQVVAKEDGKNRINKIQAFDYVIVG